MRVSGEAWLMFEFFMNVLCLLAASMLLHLSGRLWRVMLSALLFALLSVWQRSLPPFFYSPVVVLLTPLPMALCAFGKKRWVYAAQITLVAGFLFSGLCAYLKAHGVPPFGSFFVCSALLLPLFLFGRTVRAQRECTLVVTLQGKKQQVRAIIDTGNRLRDESGAVVVIPRQLLNLPKALFASGVPKGYCLLSAQTIAGKTLMTAFYPDGLEILDGGKTIGVKKARVALAAQGQCALIPPCLIERGQHHVQFKSMGIADQADSLRQGIQR